MTLAGRKQIADTLTEIVCAEYKRAHGARSLIQRGLRVLAEQAQHMGMQPEDVLTPSGRDAFTVIARAIFVPLLPKAPRGRLAAEWQTVIQLAA